MRSTAIPDKTSPKRRQSPPSTEASDVVPIELRRRIEQRVLGSMIRDRLCIPDVRKLLPREEMFSLYHHQIIYRVITDLHADAKYIDGAAVAERLRRDGLVEEIGGYVYIAELLDEAPTGAGADHYAGLVLEHHLLLQAASAADELRDGARQPNGSAVELLTTFEKRLAELAHDGVTSEPMSLQQALAEQMTVIDNRTSRSIASGIPTGFVDLDELLIGLQPSEMAVVGARPSVGKTSLGINIARNIAASGRRVLFVSLEQSRQEIAERLLARESGIDSYRLKTGRLSAADATRLIEAQALMQSWKLLIDDAPHQTATTITATARREHRRYGLDAVFVDYLQFVAAENHRANRYEQVGAISRRLKQLARDLKIPVVVMCQVNRESGDGDSDGKPPKLHQLRESGNIEQDLDVALLLHRQEPANVETGKPELIRVEVAKNRNGPRGVALLAHRPATLRFENYDDGPKM